MPVLDFTQLETVVSAKATIIKKKKKEKKLWEPAGFERWSDRTLDGCSIDSATEIT
jgi:hypothetical protein